MPQLPNPEVALQVRLQLRALLRMRPPRCRVETLELILNALALFTIPLYVVPDTILRAGIAPEY